MWSEVCITCENKALHLFIDAISKGFEPELEVIGNGKYRLYWPAVKWYPNYEEVKAIEEMTQYIIDHHKNEDGYHFNFYKHCEDGEIRKIEN